MFFGLSNAPANFQGYIHKILDKKLDIFVIVYLDYILIYTEDLSQPDKETIYWVLNQLKKYDLFTKRTKWQSHQDKV